MNPLRAVLLVVFFTAAASAGGPVSARAVADSLSKITLDSSQTFHVRDLQLRRGGVNFYFTDGVLSFATAVEGKRVAAVFSTFGVELGDAEVLVLPPQAAERQSLANFAHAPNLDEHFRYAILYFTDDTADELLGEIGRSGTARMPDIDPRLRSEGERVLRNTSAQVKTRMVAAILDPGGAEGGFFYSAVQGRDLGGFDVLYNPRSSEPVTLGRVSADKGGVSRFELWANYQPKGYQPPDPPAPVISNYAIDATVQSDLSLSATAGFELAAAAASGRVVSLNISGRLSVTSAAIDGAPVEIFQQVGDVSNDFDSDAEFLLVSGSMLDRSHAHHVEISYSGSIISQQAGSSYLVAERNLWYPHSETMFTRFDLRFHCPEQFEIVSSGEALGDRVANGMRTVHRKTLSPEQMVGFNLGQYDQRSIESAPYRVESYEDQSLSGDFNGIPEKAAQILRHYSAEWPVLSDRTLAITPVPGDFGQGFPGLIYLARTAYLPEAARPTAERAEQSRIFFSDLLLPHEIAHQWWGNMVTADGYRSDWLMEAMANDSALEFIAAHAGAATVNSVLEQYRTDLGQEVNGNPIEASGPVDFGTRIMTTAGFVAWQTVLYKKGTWVLHMLRARMGNANFIKMQSDVLRTYAGKPLSNEDFRRIASRYIPADQPDRDLELFFETWVYGTGIPRIHVNRSGTKLQVSGVDEVFAADLPLHCKGGNGRERVRWLRIEAGENATPAAGCGLPPRLDYLYFPQ